MWEIVTIDITGMEASSVDVELAINDDETWEDSFVFFYLKNTEVV